MSVSPFNAANYNFAPQTPRITLTAGSQATVRLAPCPMGVSGAGKDHYLYISGGSSKSANISTAMNTTPAAIVAGAALSPVTGNLALISGSANPRINGPWKITAVNGTTFTLDDSSNTVHVFNATHSGPIVITTRPKNQDNGWHTGDTVTIAGVRGNIAANGTFAITRINGHEFSLNDSIGNGDYVPGAGTATGAYASTGSVTIGPEAVLITGGTCTSGARSGTVVFTPANNHRGPWTIRSATAGIQEAINAAQAAGVRHVYIPGDLRPYQIYGPITVPGNFLIEGAGAATVLKLNAAIPAVSIFQVSGTAGVTTTSATPLSFAGRAEYQTDTIVFTSPSGFSTGDLVAVNSGTEPIHGNTFFQVDTISAMSGPIVTFDNPIVVPVGITLGSSIARIVPAKGVTIRYLTLDGSSTGAERYEANTGLFGMTLSNTSNSVIDHIWFRNFTASGALATSVGYANQFTNLYDENSGTEGIFGLGFAMQSNAQIHNISSTNSSGFAVGIVQSTNLNVSGLTVMHAADRGIKLNGLAWSNLSGIIVENCAYTGYSITQGTYRTQTHDIISSGNQGDEGIWFSDQDNQYNLVDGVMVNGNAGAGVIIYYSDHHNVVRNISGQDSIGDVGANNTMAPATQFRSAAYSSSGQSIPANAETPLKLDTNVYDVGGIHSNVTDPSRFTIPGTEAGITPNANYLISAQVQFAQDGTGTRILSAWKNGDTPVCSQTAVPSASRPHYLSLSCTVALLPGEYIQFAVFQDTAGSLNAIGGPNSTFGSLVRMQ